MSENETKEKRLEFSCDYTEGAHPEILKRLAETNFEQINGYGQDAYCESAEEKIRSACGCPDADVFFLVGGTQTNATVIDALLRNYQGVLSADCGHINIHEAGAVEFCGHKVLPLPHRLGKINANDICSYLKRFYADGSWDHMVQPGMVYISHPTEYGALYSKKELEDISAVCREYKLPLFLDGARLGYGLEADGTDVTLKLLAKLCDAFYIGGTKCGALFGEAVVIPQPGLIPHFFTTIKQHGALLAKGWLLGLQFDTLFTDDLYKKISRHAIEMAYLLKDGLKAKGCHFLYDSPTNQQFLILADEELERLSNKVHFSDWEPFDKTHRVVRAATSWATKEENVRSLIELFSV